MANVIASSGKLLVGNTTKEKSISHRIPRGVVTLDDEGDVQISDGIKPGGYNPLKGSTVYGISRAEANDYYYRYRLFSHVAGALLGRVIGVDNANDIYELEYYDMNGDLVSIRSDEIATLNIKVNAGEWDPEKPVSLYILTESVRYLVRRESKVPIASGMVDIDSRSFINIDLPLEVDGISVSGFNKLIGAVSGLLHNNGSCVGLFTTPAYDANNDSVGYNNGKTAGEGSITDVMTITWGSDADREYRLGDMSAYSLDGQYFIPVLSYDRNNLTNGRLDVYSGDGFILESRDVSDLVSLVFSTEGTTALQSFAQPIVALDDSGRIATVDIFTGKYSFREYDTGTRSYTTLNNISNVSDETNVADKGVFAGQMIAANTEVPGPDLGYFATNVLPLKPRFGGDGDDPERSISSKVVANYHGTWYANNLYLYDVKTAGYHGRHHTLNEDADGFTISKVRSARYELEKVTASDLLADIPYKSELGITAASLAIVDGEETSYPKLDVTLTLIGGKKVVMEGFIRNGKVVMPMLSDLDRAVEAFDEAEDNGRAFDVILKVNMHGDAVVIDRRMGTIIVDGIN